MAVGIFPPYGALHGNYAVWYSLANKPLPSLLPTARHLSQSVRSVAPLQSALGWSVLTAVCISTLCADLARKANSLGWKKKLPNLRLPAHEETQAVTLTLHLP